MPYSLNGQSATPYINGTRATVKLNGSTVYQPGPIKQWVYIGTSSSSYDGTFDAGYVSGSCRSESAIQSVLEQSRPASNYSVGYIMQVQHYVESTTGFPYPGDGTPVVSCTTYYYEVQEM